jgi:hypothetical protein
MTRTICVASSTPVGCTFLDWSLHFLSGQEQYYHVEQQEWRPLTHSPLGKINAHGHDKNHPNGLDITRIFAMSIELEQQKQHARDRLFSFYAIPMSMRIASKRVGANSFNEISNPGKLAQAQALIKQDFVDMIQHCLDNNIDVVYVQPDETAMTYHWRYRSDNRLFNNGLTATPDEQRQEFQNAFFSESQSIWLNHGLTEIWDQRERIALDFRPFDMDNFLLDRDVGFDKPHQRINSQDYWVNTDAITLEIMHKLELAIDNQRYHEWQPIARQWQKIHLQSIKFYRELDHIVTATINGWYYDMGELGLLQEAIIQHCLIYKHNLNLKTWGLSKFPHNTQDLHVLLEDNIHTVPVIY